MSELDELEKKIRDAKGPGELEDDAAPPVDATRVAIELVSGVLVGSFIGYHIDKYFDTLPIFFIICFFLGVAGGAFTLYKLATTQDDRGN